jgi:hypothetical protein
VAQRGSRRVVLLDPQRFNAYRYARNDPINWIDPDGRDEVVWDADGQPTVFGDAPPAVQPQIGPVENDIGGGYLGGITGSTGGRYPRIRRNQDVETDKYDSGETGGQEASPSTGSVIPHPLDCLNLILAFVDSFPYNPVGPFWLWDTASLVGTEALNFYDGASGFQHGIAVANWGIGMTGGYVSSALIAKGALTLDPEAAVAGLVTAALTSMFEMISLEAGAEEKYLNLVDQFNQYCGTGLPAGPSRPLRNGVGQLRSSASGQGTKRPR